VTGGEGEKVKGVNPPDKLNVAQSKNGLKSCRSAIIMIEPFVRFPIDVALSRKRRVKI